jgi:thiol:disulfide interchange protein DsbC
MTVALTMRLAHAEEANKDAVKTSAPVVTKDEPKSCPVKASAENCMKCHQMTKEEVAKVLTSDGKQKITVNAINIAPAPIKGFWETFVEVNGNKQIIYIDFTKRYIVVGNIIDSKEWANLTMDSFNKLNKVDISQIPTDTALLLGSKDAKHKIIVFDDPDCPYCKKLHSEIKKVIEADKNIAFYIKLYPLPIHKDAYKKSITISCEKSVQLLEDNFEGKSIPDKPCDKHEIDANLELGKKLGINGVPAIIMPDGSVMPGFMTSEQIIEKVKTLK